MTTDEAKALELYCTLQGDRFYATVARFFSARPDIAKWINIQKDQLTGYYERQPDAPISWDWIQSEFDNFYDYTTKQIRPEFQNKSLD